MKTKVKRTCRPDQHSSRWLRFVAYTVVASDNFEIVLIQEH